MRYLLRLSFLTVALLGAVQPAGAQDGATRKLRVGVLPGLHYDTPRFAVSPGEAIELRFVNGDEMPHNFVLTKPGQRLAVVNAALALGAEGPAQGWVPEREDILQAIAELGPGKEQTLSFTAPTERGIYPYVCTYPGHGFLMFGAMYVGTPMPAKIADDENCSPGWRSGELEAPADAGHQHHQHGEQPAKPNLHAWPADRRPLVYRIFMPDCSPAAFAVALPGGINYCWDASSCRLRYAWHGDFVDPMPVWKGNGNGLAEIRGERWVTFRDRYVHPEVPEGTAAPTPEFLGHRRVEGHPEFRYRWGDYEVRELLRALPEGGGLRIETTWRRLEDGDDGSRDHQWMQNPISSREIGEVVEMSFDEPSRTSRFTITLARTTAGAGKDNDR